MGSGTGVYFNFFYFEPGEMGRQIELWIKDTFHVNDESALPKFIIRDKEAPLKSGSALYLGYAYEISDFDYELEGVDETTSIKISFEEDKREKYIEVKEEMINEDGYAEIPFWLKDEDGNKTCVIAEVAVNMDEELLKLLPEDYFEIDNTYHEVFCPDDTTYEDTNVESTLYNMKCMIIGENLSLEEVQDFYKRMYKMFSETLEGKEKIELIKTKGINEDYVYEQEERNLCVLQELYRVVGSVPENVLKRFTEEGGYIEFLPIDELNEKYKCDYIDRIAGNYVSSEGKINVGMEEEEFDFLHIVIWHELGHFVDHMCGWISDQEFMTNMYMKLKAEYDMSPLDNETGEYNYWLGIACYREYAFENQHEFFADTFVNCMLEPGKMQEKYPELYEYMMECIESL